MLFDVSEGDTDMECRPGVRQLLPGTVNEHAVFVNEAYIAMSEHVSVAVISLSTNTKYPFHDYDLFRALVYSNSCFM